MTFKELVKTIPYSKIKPKDYKRELWYFFPEDQEIYFHDVKTYLGNLAIPEDLKLKILAWTNFVHLLNSSSKLWLDCISDKAHLPKWLDYLIEHNKEKDSNFFKTLGDMSSVKKLAAKENIQWRLTGRH